MNILNWILERSSEKSTWLGIIGIVTAAGITLQPDMQEALISLALSIAGLIAILTKDKK